MSERLAAFLPLGHSIAFELYVTSYCFGGKDIGRNGDSSVTFGEVMKFH
jgi:hypothetical protein